MQDNGNPILNNVEPNRRSFVKKVLAGAAFTVPVIATFSIESLFVDSAYAQCGRSNSSAYASGPSGLPDLGYVGPAVFQAYVDDVSGNTRVNGEVTLSVDSDRGQHRDTTINVRIRMTKDAQVSSASLTVNGYTVANIELHASDDFGHGDHDGRISATDIQGLCDLDNLFQDLASQQVTAVVAGTYSGTPFNAQGPVKAASASPIIQING